MPLDVGVKMGEYGEKWGKCSPTCVAVEARAISYVNHFRHSLDARNRVTVPSTWRVEGDDQNYYLAWPHVEGCIAVFPPEMQQELHEKLKSIPQHDLEGQAMLRELFGMASYMGCDKQGRILLPQNLLEFAGITKDVVMVGLGRNFQIWSPDRWQPPPSFNLLEAMKKLGI